MGILPTRLLAIGFVGETPTLLELDSHWLAGFCGLIERVDDLHEAQCLVRRVERRGLAFGGKVERLFGRDGLDETAIDTCELYVQENGNSVNRTIVTPACEDMGRSNSARNFIEAIEGKAAPLNTPDQALRLMQIIDALYQSAESGKPVSI